MKTVTYKDNHETSSAADSRLQSITVQYTGHGKGDEIADDTLNYKLNKLMLNYLNLWQGEVEQNSLILNS